MMASIFNNKDNVTQISVNGKTITITGDVHNVRVDNGNIVINSVANTPENGETLPYDIPAGEVERVSGMNKVIDMGTVHGLLDVDGMNAEIDITTLEGTLIVNGMNPEILIQYMGKGAHVIVDGMNALVKVDSADFGASISVSGMNGNIRLPSSMATNHKVQGLNSAVRFH